ncbi:MAG: polysaccharide deacetylase family protein, partial [Calditrichaceae bacterium]
TIDDGPDSAVTRDILFVLQKYNAKATFFLIGNRVKNNKQVVSQIIEQGHELGNHMLTGETTICLPHDEFTRQFIQTDSILSEFSDVHWLRPGSGWYSDDMLKYLAENDKSYQCVLGSVYPFDAQIPSSVFSTVFISINIRPGSIIVLHDRGERGRRTVKTISRIIPKLQEKGYRFVTLSELFRTNNNDNME